jgi:glycosyltransferase involved in cell wall biosynthesis
MNLRNWYSFCGKLLRLPKSLQTLKENIIYLQQQQQQQNDLTEIHNRQILLLNEKINTLERLQNIYIFTQWLEQITIAETLMISVIMPTYNRAHVIPRAIASVLAQSYKRWNLIIVDDGSTDDTQQVLKSYNDNRIHILKINHAGLSAARNHALDHILDGAVVYLDDDNIMQRDWLKAVAWAFQHWPNKNIILSARIMDDYNRVTYQQNPGLPQIQFPIFDREQLQQGNIADIGVIAHRHIPWVRFDENLKTLEDWDFLLQLTANEAPIELPYISIIYTSDCSNRLSYQISEIDFNKVYGKIFNLTIAKS